MDIPQNTYLLWSSSEQTDNANSYWPYKNQAERETESIWVRKDNENHKKGSEGQTESIWFPTGLQSRDIPINEMRNRYSTGGNTPQYSQHGAIGEKYPSHNEKILFMENMIKLLQENKNYNEKRIQILERAIVQELGYRYLYSLFNF